MNNPNHPGYNPDPMNQPPRVTGAKAFEEAAADDDDRQEENTLLEDGIPETDENRSEADKEAESRPEDFEPFDVNKVDDLQKEKEDGDE